MQSIYEEMTEPTYDDIAGNTTHNEISNGNNHNNPSYCDLF